MLLLVAQGPTGLILLWGQGKIMLAVSPKTQYTPQLGAWSNCQYVSSHLFLWAEKLGLFCIPLRTSDLPFAPLRSPPQIETIYPCISVGVSQLEALYFSVASLRLHPSFLGLLLTEGCVRVAAPVGHTVSAQGQ